MAHVSDIGNSAGQYGRMAVLLLTGVILLAVVYFGTLYFFHYREPNFCARAKTRAGGFVANF